MDPYATPNSQTDNEAVRQWPRRVAAVLVILLFLTEILRATSMAYASKTLDFDWTSEFATPYVVLTLIFLFKAAIAATYFIGWRWFAWVLLLTVAAVHVIPSDFPYTIANTPFQMTILCLLMLNFAIFDRRFAVPWRSLDVKT